MKATAYKILYGLKGYGFTVLDEEMRRRKDKFVLAGGAVANMILSLEDQTPYPINDLDYYRLVKDRYRPEEIVQVAKPFLGHYLDFSSSYIKIQGREQDTENKLDIIEVSSTGVYNVDTDTRFPAELLKSFDLNCVQAAIYWNGDEYILVTTPEFDRFLETRNVEIVNVHSEVTFARLLKKRDDLKATCDMDLEIKIVQNARSVEYMSKMKRWQLEKHKEYRFTIKEILKKVQSLCYRDEKIYEALGNSNIKNARIPKIRVLRELFTTDSSTLRYLFTNAYGRNLLGYMAIYDGDDFLDSRLHTDNIRTIETFMNRHQIFSKFYFGKTLGEIMRTVVFLSGFPKEFLKMLENVISNGSNVYFDPTEDKTPEELLQIAIMWYYRDKTEIKKVKDSEDFPF